MPLRQRANQAAAGVGCPLRPDTSDTANPDRLTQEDLAAGTAGAGGASPAPDPHAGAASPNASMQLPKATWRNPMLIGHSNVSAGSRTSGRKTTIGPARDAAPADCQRAPQSSLAGTSRFHSSNGFCRAALGQARSW